MHFWQRNSRETLAKTMSKRLDRLDMEWQGRNQIHRQRHSGDQSRTCPGRIRRSSGRARCRTPSGGLSDPSGRRCSTVRWRRRPLPGETSSFASSHTMVERPPILESGPSSGVKIGPSSFESWTAFSNTVVTLPGASCRGRCDRGPRSVRPLLGEQRPWYVACGEDEGLVEDYWIVVILCVWERR